jgi:hypothetical protein
MYTTFYYPLVCQGSTRLIPYCVYGEKLYNRQGVQESIYYIDFKFFGHIPEVL